jgi:hypothetical protein
MRKIVLSIIISFLLLLPSINSFSQNKPMLAVPTISAKGVSEITASVCRNMVETALIKTGVYSVLSYTDIEEILEAQAFTLSGCTDEACAIEIGKLLAADTIVVGELSSLGEKMNLSIRMMDVTTGMTRAAETVVIDSVDTMQDSTFTAAYSLVGLKYIAGSSVEETGELFITAPDGMVLQVLLDGVEKGNTPLLIDSVPFGVHIIEAKIDNYSYIQEISVNSKDVKEIVADASLLKGNLFLSVKPDIADGWVLIIDNVEYKAGLIKDITAGEQNISVLGNGWSYNGKVTIVPKKTSKVEINLSASGTLVLFLSDETIVKAKSEDGTIFELDPRSETTLPQGKYTLEIEHPDFEPYEEVFFMEQGKYLSLTPELQFNEQYSLRLLLTELEQKKEMVKRKEEIFSRFTILAGGIAITAAGISGLGEYMVHNRTSYLEDTYIDYSAATDIDVLHELGDNIDGAKYSINQWRDVRNASLISAGIFGIITPILSLGGKTSEDYERQIDELREKIQ